MQTILFIRHAESEASASTATMNDATIALTNKGKQQAIALAESITQSPELIIYSKYLRAQYTAAPLIGKFPNVPVKILPLHEFSYLSPALCAATTANQRKSWLTDYWEKAGPEFVHGPGAESFTQFIERINLCIELLTAEKHGNKIVFTHGHVLRAIWQLLMGLKFTSAREQMDHFHQQMSLLPVPNTCIFKAGIENDQMKIIEPQFIPA